MTLDLFEHALSLSPNLSSSLISGLDTDTATSQDKMDSFKVFSLEELCPLYGLLRKLHCLVDDCVYIQQCAGRSKVGYEVFYEYKIAHMEDSPNFSSQAAAKDFWAQDKLDSEQRMAQMKSQEEILPMPLA